MSANTVDAFHNNQHDIAVVYVKKCFWREQKFFFMLNEI